MERKYTIDNVRDYILYHYGAEWKDFKVYDHFEERELLPRDFNEDILNIRAVLKKGDEVLYGCLFVSNERLSLYNIEPIIDVLHSRKKWWTWEEFLSKEQNLQTI